MHEEKHSGGRRKKKGIEKKKRKTRRGKGQESGYEMEGEKREKKMWKRWTEK